MISIGEQALTSVVDGLYLCVLDETVSSAVTSGIIVLKTTGYTASYKQIGTCNSITLKPLNNQAESYISWIEPVELDTPGDYVATQQFGLI